VSALRSFRKADGARRGEVSAARDHTGGKAVKCNSLAALLAHRHRVIMTVPDSIGLSGFPPTLGPLD